MRTTTLLYVALLGGCSLTGAPDRLRDCADCPEMVTVSSGVAILGATAAVAIAGPMSFPNAHSPFVNLSR